MRTFYFLRHGLTDWNVAERMQGQSDIPLNETGVEQAKAAAPFFTDQNIKHIICSPLKRTVATASFIGEVLYLPLETDRRLMERNFGAIEGLTPQEIDQADPLKVFDLSRPLDEQGYHHPLGAETMAELGERGFQAVKEGLEKHEGDNVLFVAHGAWFRALMYKLTNGEVLFRSDNAVPYRCSFDGKKWKIEDLRV